MKQNAVETGFTNASAASWIPPTTTFASPPSSPATGAVYVFTDALTQGATVGGGTSLSTCRWSGSAWVALGGGGSSATGTMVFRGAWDGSATYNIGDVVLYAGGQYYRKVPPIAGFAHVQSRANVGVHSLAFSSNVTAGNLLVVAFHDEGTVDPSTVTDTLGTTYVKAGALTGQTNNAAIYAGIAASSGPCTVTYTTGGGWYGVVLSEFAGASAVLNVSATNYTSSTPHTVNITTTVINCLIYVVIGGQHSACTYTAITGTSFAAQAGGLDAIAGGYKFSTAATLNNVGFNQSGSADDNSPVVAASFVTTASPPPIDVSSWTVLSAPDIRGFGATFDGGGAALTAGGVAYVTVAQGGTITAWNIVVDTGTCTIKVWKIARGTAKPTSSNSINTSGLAISTGTAIHSTTLSDFTTLAVADGDIVGITTTAVSGATQINFTVEMM